MGSPIKAFEESKNINVRQLQSAIAEITSKLNKTTRSADNIISKELPTWRERLKSISDLVNQHLDMPTATPPPKLNPQQQKEIIALKKKSNNLIQAKNFLQGNHDSTLSGDIINTLEEAKLTEIASVLRSVKEKLEKFDIQK